MKKYYSVSMTLKNMPTKDEVISVDGRYVIENEEELSFIVEQLAAESGKFVDDYDVHYERCTLQNFIAYEENAMRTMISRDYLRRNKKDYEYLPAREYLDALHHIEDDLYYEILIEENKLRRIDTIVRRRIDISKITLTQYDELKMSLLKAKDSEEFESLLGQYPSK